jgi:uncharacterized protein YjbK
MYACKRVVVCMLLLFLGDQVRKETTLTRKSFYIDTSTLRRAKRALRVRTDAEAIRLSLERVAEMEAFWQFMTKNQGVLKRGSVQVS